MGSVFKALDPAVGRTVALKTIHSAALNGDNAAEYRARFYREVKASGVLAHPSIVPVFDVGEEDGAPFLVMEFVEGRTLADVIKKGERFPLERVCEIGQQLAEALGYAHRQGVIHRDIKPANILLTSREVYGSERPRITDFGIAKLATSEITTTGQFLGTPSFMPPEQFTGAPVDGRADLFSLGVILYSLATGDQPFPGETMTAVSYKVVHTDPVPPSKLNPTISAGFERVILKCLAKSPVDRYQTGEALAQDLATLRANPNATKLLVATPRSIWDPRASVMAQTPASPSVKKPVKPSVLVAVVLLGLAAGVGGWYLLRLFQPATPPSQQAITTLVPQPVEPAPLPAVQGVPTSTPEPAAPNQPEPSKPAATGKPAAAKPSPAVARSAQPSAIKQPAGQPAPTAAAQPHPTPAAPATDPHKLDPNTNSKFRIQLSHLPNGLPIVVFMSKAPYLSFVTGDKTDLNNLYVPPGIQTFHVTAQNGGQQVSSNIVSSEFKAKKRKNLKIELRNRGNVPAGSPAPLSPDAQIFVSLSSPLF
jgi:serine/threonine-protein kinase